MRADNIIKEANNYHCSHLSSNSSDCAGSKFNTVKQEMELTEMHYVNVNALCQGKCIETDEH